MPHGSEAPLTGRQLRAPPPGTTGTIAASEGEALMQRVSGPDAAFLYGETRSWHMHVSSILMADPSTAPHGFTVERLRENTAKRIEQVPQFRWRVVEVPFGIDNPVFVEDPTFDIDYHVRHVAVPPPGGPRQLGDLVGDLASYKLTRTRPSW